MTDAVAIAIVGSVTTITTGILAAIVAKLNNVKPDVRIVKADVKEMKARMQQGFPATWRPAQGIPAAPGNPMRNADT